jgi:hypothetical protein
VSFLAILSVACGIPARPSFSEWSLRVPPKVELRTPTTVYSAMYIRGGSAAVMNAGVMRSGSSYQLVRDEEVQPFTIHALRLPAEGKIFFEEGKKMRLRHEEVCTIVCEEQGLRCIPAAEQRRAGVWAGAGQAQDIASQGCVSSGSA